MRMRHKIHFTIICIFIYIIVFPFIGEAKKNKTEEVDIFELSIDENIETPKLGKFTNKIIDVQTTQINNLKQLTLKGYPYDIKAIRNGEVIMITIPMRQLFSANNTKLSNSGEKILEPILKYCNNENLYKVILIAHADNTGNDIYAKTITDNRVNSIYDWIGKNGNNKLVVPYGLGNSDPVVDNNSVSNRDKNRRLVVYIIPEKALIELAKRNKIVL